MIEYAPFHKQTFTNRLCKKWTTGDLMARLLHILTRLSCTILYDDVKAGWYYLLFIFEASKPVPGRIGAQGKSTES